MLGFAGSLGDEFGLSLDQKLDNLDEVNEFLTEPAPILATAALVAIGSYFGPAALRTGATAWRDGKERRRLEAQSAAEREASALLAELEADALEHAGIPAEDGGTAPPSAATTAALAAGNIIVDGELAPLLDAERLNGRLAMVGFAAVAAIELAKGSNFEFFPEALNYVELYLPRALAGEAISLVNNFTTNTASPVEDAYLGLLVGTTLFALGQMVNVQRKSKTIGSDIHVWAGVGQFVVALYAILLERVYREVPGWGWMWTSFALTLASCVTVGPLFKYYRGPRVYNTLFLLGQDFTISFQGIQLIAWSAQPDAPPWMFWLVMPFWLPSVGKLVTSAKYISALIPEETYSPATPGPVLAFREQSLRDLQGIAPDAPTFVYVGLNLAAALFDNAWMLLYTVKGPIGFWAYSAQFAPEDVKLSLIKPAVGGLTVSVVVFLGTLVARRKLPAWLGGGLNVVLASVGPWIVLWWHRIITGSEAWFPQFLALPAGASAAPLIPLSHLDDGLAFLF